MERAAAHALGHRHGAARLKATRWLILPSALACVTLPFLVSGVFPSQDGPAHLHTAGLLAGLRDGSARTAALFVETVHSGTTNVIAYWLLSRLVEFLTPVRAEWSMALALSLLLLGSVLAAPRLLGGRIGDVWPGLLLCAPLMLYMGSFALVLAMAPAFLSLVFAARLVRSPRLRDALACIVAALIACAAQIQVAVPILAASLGGGAGMLAWRWLGRGRFPVARPMLTLVAVSLPVAAAALAYGASAPPGHAALAPRWDPLLQAATLGLRGDVVWFSLADPILAGLASAATGMAAAAWLLGAMRNPRSQALPAEAERQQVWLFAAALVVAAAVVVLPRETAAVPQVPQRLAPFAHFLLFLWFLVTPLAGRWRRAVLASALGAVLTLTASRVYGHHALERRLHAELAWAEAQIPAGAVVAFVRLPSVLDTKYPALSLGGLPLRFDMTTHLGRGIAHADVVSFSNYQIMPVWRIFRVRLRPKVFASIDGLTEMSVMIAQGDLDRGLGPLQAALRRATGREIEMILLWTGGLDPAAAAARHPHLAAFLRDLRADFELRGRSRPAGLVEVWSSMSPP